jgi:DNA helicase HerA-like ATPase
MLYLKKKMGYKTPVLAVLDEAQEFIPRDAKGTAHDSNLAVEALLRQGRKYKLYAWISTQRVAYLNTNALQQLHSYFVSTLPRLYDRMVIADAFSLDYSILDKTANLQTGEWLFVSYKATRQKNIPAFITVENNEDIIAEWVRSNYD